MAYQQQAPQQPYAQPQQQIYATPQQNHYQATPQMNTGGVQMVQGINYEKSGGLREWKFGLFDCFSDFGLSIKTYCLPCITYGEIKAKVNNDPSSCTGQGCIYGVVYFCGFHWILGGLGRGETRGKLGIEGSVLGDIFTHICCPVCALVQEHREAHAI